MNYLVSNLLDKACVTHGFGFKGYSISSHKHFATNQLHSDNIIILKSSENYSFPLEADAFITNERNIACYVRTADCVPILMYDPVKKVIGAIHSGWRGTLLQLATKAVAKFEADFGSRRENIIAAIGPAVGGDCYEVGDEVIWKFREAGFAVANRHLDLKEINRSILQNAGIKNIGLIPICNHCDTRFASYRRDKSEKGRQISFIVM
ncbi:MAG: peptidoglycan editing factor PgeF [Deltaproteobacteria bacterium]|nr:peptidoglycan editing factor PgeF [Deltaproteobacteria bacterium]